MTKELRASIEKIKNLTPKLNLATDEAVRTVVAVESFLNECSVGMPALAWSESEHDQTTEEEGIIQKRGLSYQRVDGKYRISVVTSRDRVDEHGDWFEELSRQACPWVSAPREDRLFTFRLLPDLLDKIAETVEATINQAEGTADTVKKIIMALDSPNSAGLESSK